MLVLLIVLPFCSVLSANEFGMHPDSDLKIRKEIDRIYARSVINPHVDACRPLKDEDISSSVPLDFYLTVFGQMRSSVVIKRVNGYFVAEEFLRKLISCDCNTEVDIKSVKQWSIEKFENRRLYGYVRNVQKTLRNCLYAEVRALGLGAELFQRVMQNARHCSVYKQVEGSSRKSFFPMGTAYPLLK